MRNIIIIFIFNLIVTQIFAKKNTDFINLDLGVSETALKFKTKDDTEINTKKIKLQRIGFGKTFREKNYFLKLKGNYAKQKSNIQNNDKLLDLEILYGKYRAYSPYFRSSFALGYGSNAQELNFLNEEVKHLYKTNWTGPKFSLSTDYRRGRQNFSLSYDYQYSDFEGHLTSDTTQIKQTGKGHGQKFNATYEHALSKSGSFVFNIFHYNYSLTRGYSTTNTETKQDLTMASFKSTGINLTYRFLF